MANTKIVVSIPSEDIKTLDVYHPCKCPLAVNLKKMGFFPNVGRRYVEFRPFDLESGLSPIVGGINLLSIPVFNYLGENLNYLDVFREMIDRQEFFDVVITIAVDDAVFSLDYQAEA